MLGGIARTTSWGLSLWLLGVVALAVGCSGKNHSDDDDDDGGDGGGGQSGETSSGGTTSKGGSSNGGTTSKGGSSSGGTVSNGGSSNGGSSNGGSSNGGTVSSGGSSNGGTVSNGGSGGGVLVGGSGGDLTVGGTGNGGSGGDVAQGGTFSGGSGGGGGEPPDGECSDGFNVETGGYVTSSGETCWRGYAFTVTDSLGTTITPEEFSGCADPTCLCVSGTVIGDSAFGGYASIGFNVNQAPEPEASKGTITPTGGGLTIAYTNTGSTGLRAQIGNSTTNWCYDGLMGTSGVVTIPYTSFNTECWEGGAGTYYSGGAISSVQLVVPGSGFALDYNVCLLGALDGT